MQEQQARSLKGLAAGVGRDFLRRALPALPAYVLLLLLTTAALWGDSGWQLGAAVATLLVSAGMVGAMARRRYRWAGWQVAAALLLLALRPAWSGLELAAVDRLVTLVAVVAVLQVAWSSLRLFGFSQRLQRVADAIPEERVLELLPPEAADRVRAWLAGDAAAATEIKVVVRLALLCVALQEAGTRGELRRWAYASRDLRR
ncbi:hypothetical protein IB227_15800 [Stenotrophomonas sp. STM01]|uniref:hypothetical protein n=1 Tax=unclassified Stenotrophomonas TaxID=196198 RepID=UPI001783515E|nr:hypothetical protein [Stenotrophomonas sp. STM01]MBD9537312.1 hypothetical protein [Stenotrophomonas sp. STM01]